MTEIVVELTWVDIIIMIAMIPFSAYFASKLFTL